MDDLPDRGYSRAPELRDLAALCRSMNRENAGPMLTTATHSVRIPPDVDDFTGRECPVRTFR